ncbi:hypothetical protein AZE42_01281 [Rhizopogon vesiculosus]|uniref:Uncharacterized protein n=1 Tax=Rhizopogon vesiculosus TaxID=180088 RepID=A0A1J8PIM4_9AGAM|nr:hypothetical protein AZE42_01281 [Rhizopogon vesiculosus]
MSTCSWSPELSGSSAPTGYSLLQRPRPSPARFWNALIPSRIHPPTSESMPLQDRLKRSFLARHSKPPPVTVTAGRPRTSYWTASPAVLLEEGSYGGTDAQTQPESTVQTTAPSETGCDSTPSSWM